MNKKKIAYGYFAIVVLLGIIVACSGEQSDKEAGINGQQDTVVEPGEDTTAREPGFFDRHPSPYTNKVLAAYNAIKKKRKYITHFTQTGSSIFFLLQSGESAFKKSGAYNPKTRFALLDDKGNYLLPMEYEQIGNPGFIADDYIEIKKDGKYGLYNYTTKSTIQPAFDVLFPSRIMEYIAIGEKDGTLFKIYPDGRTKTFKEGQPAPNYVKLLTDFRFNYDSDFYGWWYDVAAFQFMDSEYYTEEYRPGMMAAPSFIVQLGIYPNFITDIYTTGDSLDIQVSKGVVRENNTFAFLTEAYQYFSESRGYATWNKNLITVDKVNRKKASVKLYEFDDYLFQNATQDAKPAAKFINDSVIEVKNYVENKTTNIAYERYTKYEYYFISRDGTVTKEDRGLFPMASSIELSRMHFKGCFTRNLSEEEILASPNYDPEMEGIPMYSYTDHLSLEDLIYLRNEIYARHGLRFKDQAIAAVFKSFKWYKGTKNNVDALLTPVEKKNIQLLKKLEKELRSDPSALVHETSGYYVMAG